MTDLNNDQQAFIESSWKNKWNGILHAQNQLLNWIFAVHAGGVAGLLAFASSKDASCSVKVGLGAFSIGLMLLVVYGVLMFYTEVHHFKKFKGDMDDLFRRQIDWTEFTARENRRPDRYLACEIIAWVSGIFSLVGVVSAIFAII